jgi:hypothetical protein
LQAQAARAAGDQRGLAGEGKQFLCCTHVSSLLLWGLRY